MKGRTAHPLRLLQWRLAVADLAVITVTPAAGPRR